MPSLRVSSAHAALTALTRGAITCRPFGAGVWGCILALPLIEFYSGLILSGVIFSQDLAREMASFQRRRMAST